MKKLFLLLTLMGMVAVGCSKDEVDKGNDNKIYYTTSDNTKLFPKTDASLYGAILISNTYKDGQGVLVFDDAVTTIGMSAFEDCSSLTSVTIPDSVTTIGDDAFYNCTSLTSINIPESVTSIGKTVFSGCTGELIINSKIVETDYTGNNYPSYYGWLKEAKFTKLTIGDSVTSIGERAFENCSSLISVTITDSVTTIGERAFENCSSLISVTITDSVTTIGERAFYRCSSLQEFNGKFASEDGRCLIIDGVLNSFAIGCGATEYTIPNSVTTIGAYAFYRCESLTSVTIQDSVTTIGYSAFYGCKGLTSVTIPDSVTTIGERAFAWCTSLTSVTIGDSVTTIEDDAFWFCRNLTSITIPDSVTTIGDGAFYDCESLTSVYCKATTPPVGGFDMFHNNATGRDIYVPTESVNAYKSASGWSEYKSCIVGYNF